MTNQDHKDLPANQGPDFPSARKLRVYGDFSFLALRSQRHLGMQVSDLRASFEAPIELGQFRIFRFDDIPRSLFTWAWLGPDAERRYVTGQALKPEDWRSGDHQWIIDIICPYQGLIKGMGRWIMTPGNFTENDYYFRRVIGANQTKKIVHVDLRTPDNKARILSEEDFI